VPLLRSYLPLSRPANFLRPLQATPRAGDTPRAGHTPRGGRVIQHDEVDLDGERIQLGKKYHTQGTVTNIDRKWGV